MNNASVCVSDPTAARILLSTLKTGKSKLYYPPTKIYVMHRRSYLGTVLTGCAVATAGCAGGEVVTSVSRSVTIPAGSGKIFEIPSTADKIKFTVRDERPFDVFVFVDPADYRQYKAFLDGEDPDQRPVGHRGLGGSATQIEADLYQVATENRAREKLPGSGPTHFVVDHSGYADVTVPDEYDDPISPVVDLEAVQSTLPF